MNDDKYTSVTAEAAVLTADALKAMGHPLRWRILCQLGDKEITVGELARQIGTTQSNMSQHLDQLRNKRILTSRKEANRIYYRVRNDALLGLIGCVRTILCNTHLND